ncbi:hypothetical protein [Paracoccus yeei]|uniref:hypothetical protein n=1 Tax=Paracoccus yeei TaxID=147645 RepID=UPI0016827729|nr:hypothetical protein [Paracoccus yeei]
MRTDLIEEAITDHWGPRCPVKDIDDGPLEINGKPVGRCDAARRAAQTEGGSER